MLLIYKYFAYKLINSTLYKNSIEFINILDFGAVLDNLNLLKFKYETK